MKRILILIVPIALGMLSSCSPDKVKEGEIEYQITYPEMEISGFMEALFPETMTITFKGTKMKTTIASGKVFSTEVISNEDNRSVEMRLNFGDKLMYTVLDKSEVQEMVNSQPKYEIESTEHTDSIAGMHANGYNVSTKDGGIRAKAWFTEDLIHANAYWFTSYAKVKGFPLIFDVERYGVLMHMEATSLNKREVSDKEFERDPALKEVSFKTYEKQVQELFDIMLY